MAKLEDMRKKSVVKKVRLPPATVHPDLLKRLNAFCADRGYYRSNVVEKALEELLDREEKGKKK